MKQKRLFSSFTKALMSFGIALLMQATSGQAQTVRIYRAGVATGTTYTSIKSAIAAAIDGDSLKLSAHTFNENRIIIDKDIVIAGTYTATDSSTIDAQSKGALLRVCNRTNLVVDKYREVTIRDVRLVNAYIVPSEKSLIYYDTATWQACIVVQNGSIKLNFKGNTIIANNVVDSNSATAPVAFAHILAAGANNPYEYLAGTKLENRRPIISFEDNVVFRNNIAYGIRSGLIGQFCPMVRFYFNDNILICNNTAGAFTADQFNFGFTSGMPYFVYVGGTPSPGAELTAVGRGGVRIANNRWYIGGFRCENLELKQDLIIEGNESDSNNAGVFFVDTLYGGGTLWVKNNYAHKAGGGGFVSYHIDDKSSVKIVGNRAKVGGGGLFEKDEFGGRMLKAPYLYPNIEIYNNVADSVGGGLYVDFLVGYNSVSILTGTLHELSNINMHHNKALIKANGVYINSSLPTAGTLPPMLIKFNRFRLFNPDGDGKHRGPEIYNAVKYGAFATRQCWFGQSDTVGMIKSETPGPDAYGIYNYLVIDWKFNNGLPLTFLPKLLTAQFRYNNSDVLAPNTAILSNVEGRFTGTQGYFNKPIAGIKSDNSIESVYYDTSTGMAQIMGIVDADTFRSTVAVTRIHEQGFEQVKIYPNPTTDELHINNLPAGMSLHIYDAAGRIILQRAYLDAQPNLVLQVAQLPAGVYTIKLYNQLDQMGTVQFVKE